VKDVILLMIGDIKFLVKLLIRHCPLLLYSIFSFRNDELALFYFVFSADLPTVFKIN